MKLDRIEIDNFRSVKRSTINFFHNCQILLGKNEAGKSNILKAMASLFGEYKVSNKDKRKIVDIGEVEYCVRGFLKLNKSDIDEIVDRFQSKFRNTEMIAFENGKNIKDYIKFAFKEVHIETAVYDNSTPGLFYYEQDNKKFILNNELYVKGNEILLDISGMPIFKLEEELFEIISEIYYENPYICNYWKYQSNYLLPNSLNIQNFITNPDICKPLKNMLFLCGFENVKESFLEARSKDGDYTNLLDFVSKKTTKIFQNIWDDFKDTSIQLIGGTNEVIIKVANKTKYSFDDRSDGFKKFLSILLMISTQSRTNDIGERDIILIDEPDQSLYPTSAKYLRDELLKISEKSKVIYTTHSPFMIDSNCIERHLVVEKKDDITTLRKEEENSPFSEDELLLNAIGTSVFECVKDKNIIFEGWLDKELFNKYCYFNKKSKKFDDYGKVYLCGINGVQTLVQILILANKKFIIVADSDDASKLRRRKFIENYPEYAESWLSYGDVVKDISTMEDFVNKKHIENVIKEHTGNGFKFDDKMTVVQNIDNSVNNNRDEKKKIKRKLVETLTKAKISTSYGDYIKELKNKLEKINI